MKTAYLRNQGTCGQRLLRFPQVQRPVSPCQASASLWGSTFPDRKKRGALVGVRYGGRRMADIVFIVIAVVFFAVAWAYTRACDRL